jgi:REP element-mobilizing transposase RayT
MHVGRILTPFMPRAPRLDFPGALHQVIARGIERRPIFRSDSDREDFLDRLAHILPDAGMEIYAWALIPNHLHLLLRTAHTPLSTVMRCLLGGYAVAFNRRHRRSGHLFQNRFKSILVEEETYFLELVRYIHLNPLRARLVPDLPALERYPWTGHSAVLGQRHLPWQSTDAVLEHFARTAVAARHAYWRFVAEGLQQGKRPDLDGGGLRRSAGGWEFVPRIGRGREGWAFDERILGSDAFVRSVLERINRAELPPGSAERDPEALLSKLQSSVAARCGLSPHVLASNTLRRDAVRARSLLSHLAVDHCGLSLTAVARSLHVSKQSILRGIPVGRAILEEQDWSLCEFLPG